MWQADVVAFLRECKAAGWEFDTAWKEAVRTHPPRGTGFGNARAQTALFDGEGIHEPSLTEFLEQACRDAWHDLKPQLRYLSADLLDPFESEVRFRRQERQVSTV